VANQPRHDDTYLVEFPKSGATWLCFIIANLIKRQSGLEKEVNFYNIHDFVPDINVSRDISEITPCLSGSRVVKSHAGVNDDYNKVIYLWRDPREVMKSYFRFLVTLGQFEGTFGNFVRHKKFGVPAWKQHVEGWLSESRQRTRMIYISYGSLKRETEEAIVSLLSGLGVVAAREDIKAAIEMSSFSAMQLLEEQWIYGDTRKRNNTIFSQGYRFVGNRMPIEENEDSYIMGECAELIAALE